MTINRYSPNPKIYDEIGRITPNVSYCSSEKPYSSVGPARWLPTVRKDEQNDIYFVFSAGKVVSLDREGWIVPAGYKKAFNVATSTTVLTYTATDVTEKVIDLTTGVAVTAATSYTETQVTTALRERGLIGHSERAYDFISQPIGCATYNYVKGSGTSTYNPSTYDFHNFNPQTQVGFTCDYVFTYPLMPAKETTETMANDNTGGADAALENVFNGTTTPRVAGWYNSTQIAEVTRYASQVSAGDDVVGYTFVNYPLAENFGNVPIAASVSGLVNAVGSISAISAAGDYYIDTEVGMLFVYEAGGDAIPSPWTTSATITYYHYATEGSSTNTVSTYACATGDIKFGDYLTYDKYSNLVKASLDIANAEGYDASGNLYTTDPDYGSGTDAAISLQIEKAVSGYNEGIIGQVIGVDKYPGDTGLDRVASEYLGQTNVTYQTPGNANQGRTDALPYSNSADTMIVVNILK